MFQKIKIDARGLLLVLLVLVVLPTLVSCGPPPPPSVDGVTLATAVDSDKKAVGSTTTFAPTDKFYASAQVSNVIVGTKVEARWYFGSDEISQGRTSITADKAGSGYYAFSLSSTSPFPVGDFKVEIYLDGNLVKTVSFKVA
ncbi:MAG: hypothetical protein KGJ80_00665 [Chloroflexota bacterium]|nr:hypothetical protein [Chloroflexota bacterium]